MVDKVGHFIGEAYRGVAKGFMGVLKESKFLEDGVLTPEEFIKAGDYLTQKCPTWKWCSANSLQNIKPVDYLPTEKQFLITTVRCPRRAKDYEKSNQTSEKVIEDEWVETNIDFFKDRKKDEIVDIDIDDNKKQIVIDNIANNDDIEIDESHRTSHIITS